MAEHSFRVTVKTGARPRGPRVRKLNTAAEVTDLTVFLQPYPAGTVLRDHLREVVRNSVISDDGYWELPGASG